MKTKLVSCPTCGCICKIGESGTTHYYIPFLKAKKKSEKRIKDIEKAHKAAGKSKLMFDGLDKDKKLKKFYRKAKFFDFDDVVNDMKKNLTIRGK